MSDSGNSCVSPGDTTWVLVSFVFVLSMYPGLAMFEAGLLRSKNTLSIIAQVMAGLAVNGSLWDLFGYSLVYFGNFQHSMLINVSYSDCEPIYASHIPHVTFAMFEMLFAVIAPLLMTGAFAERVKFKSSILFMMLWEVAVYYPIAHLIWGRGWLFKLGVLDFAGGITIHTTAGAGALICALFLGRRRHFDEHDGEFPPSNLALASSGVALMYCGWFGFNAGSALEAGSLAASALVSTQIGCIFSALVWMMLDLFHKGHPTVTGIFNGAIAGLAGITPASGYIDNPGSIALGIVLGFSSYYGNILIKHKLRIDDALEVSSVHGLTGMIGSIAVGLLANKDSDPSVSNGLFYGGGWRLLGLQFLGVTIAALYSALVTFLLLKCVDWAMGFKVSEEEEDVGLDIVEHKEVAYHEMTTDVVTPQIQKMLPRHYGPDLVNVRKRVQYLYKALSQDGDVPPDVPEESEDLRFH